MQERLRIMQFQLVDRVASESREARIVVHTASRQFYIRSAFAVTFPLVHIGSLQAGLFVVTPLADTIFLFFVEGFGDV